ATAQGPDYPLVRYDDPYATLHQRLARYAGRRIGFESHHVTVEQLENLKNPPDGQPAAVEWVPVKGLVEELRGRKSQEELELIQAAVDGADRACSYVLAHLRPGATEKEIAWKLEVFMREQGAEALAFPSIVASGANGALPHARPTDRPLAARSEERRVGKESRARWRPQHQRSKHTAQQTTWQRVGESRSQPQSG